MKKLTYTTAVYIAMAATSVFSHHSSEDVNPNFERVDDQLEVVDSLHLDMNMNDLDATTEAGDSTMSTATQIQAGGAFDADPPTDAVDAADTIGLLENIAQ